MVRAASVLSPTNSHDRPTAPVESLVLASPTRLRAPLSTPHIEEHQLAASNIALYIDQQQFSRDCVSLSIATRLPEWTLQSVASIHDLAQVADPPRPCLIILNLHGVRLAGPAAADEF